MVMTKRIPTIQLSANENTGEMEIELADDPMDCSRLDMNQIPICISFCKIGKKYVVDPTSEELLCMTSQLTIAIDNNGNFCEICKSGKGSFDHLSLLEMLKVSLILFLLLFFSFIFNNEFTSLYYILSSTSDDHHHHINVILRVECKEDFHFIIR